MSDISLYTIRQDNNIASYFLEDKCDCNDYLIAGVSGVIAVMVDIFLVGAPTDSKVQSWTDTQVNKVVMSFAKTCGWKPRSGKETSLASV